MSRLAFPSDLIAGVGSNCLSAYCRKSKDKNHEKAYNTKIQEIFNLIKASNIGIKEIFNFWKCYFTATDFQKFNF